MKRMTIGAIVAAMAGFTFMLAGAQSAFAVALTCDTTTGSPGAGECQITTAHAVTGAVEVDRTLHIFGNGRLDASGGGITLRICVAPAPAFSTCDLIMDTPTVVNGSQIEADDTTGSAFPIDIAVSRDVLMDDQSKILAENVASGGSGANITIVAGRDMTMGDSAKISSSKITGSGGTGVAGNITITVGDVVGHTSGIFTMGPSTVTVPKSGILANSPTSAGAIAISAGKEMHIGGLVESFSGLSGTGGQPPGGGPITVVSGCKLTVEDTGKVSSEGQDPGADLVHVEGCDVLIQGLVQSIAPGAGHVPPTAPPNHCNLDPTAHPTVLDAKVYEGCVEIWGNTVTIDSTGTHKGKVNTAGIRFPGRSWIDIFARSDITIIADTAATNYSVNADACNNINAPNAPCSNSFAGLVNIKSQSGKVVMTALVPGTVGRAVTSSAIAIGGRDGTIIVQAGGASSSGFVDFTADSLVAVDVAGAVLNGRIDVQSFNDQVLGISPGSLNTGAAGQVNLTACVGDPSTTYSGLVTGTETDAGPGVGCGGTPTFPTVAQWYTGKTVAQFLTAAASCAQVCGPTCTPSGQKFNDLLNNGIKDAGDPGVSGVQIHIFDKATSGASLHQHTLTDGSGNYSFSVPAGEYIICEQGGPAPFSPAQTFPAADGSGGLCQTHTGVGFSRGYDVVLSADVNSCTSTNNDFGNFFGASISGDKFNDLNNNGSKDAGEPPVSGLEIHLFDKATAGTTFHQHASTDASGNFSFTTVPPGEYILCEQGGPAPFSPAQTFPASDASGGMCATHTGITGSRGYDIVLGVNQAVTSQEFGNFFGGSITGTKFNDLNGNGVGDAGDPPVSGLQIHLLDKATSGATFHQDTTTDVNGNFSFTLLPPGEYILCEQGGPAPFSPAQTLPAADGSGGVCATHTGITGSRGYDIVLAANQAVTSKNFGNFFGGSISGMKFNDVNGNGVKDPGDLGLQGIEIDLFDKATLGATLHLQTLTDVNGNFSFINVPPSEYYLCEKGGPPTQTFPISDGSNGACATLMGITGTRGYDIVLSANQTVTGKDFGNAPPTTHSGGGLSGTKFNDLAGNGVKDAGDPPIQGLQIHVFDKATNGATFHQDTVTDAAGNFAYIGLVAGEYIVCEQGGPPSQTFPIADGSGGLCATHTGVPGSRGYDVTVVDNQNSGGNDFGNHTAQQPPPPRNSIPTLDEYGLMALAALLGIAGALARRRKYPVAR